MFGQILANRTASQSPPADYGLIDRAPGSLFSYCRQLRLCHEISNIAWAIVGLHVPGFIPHQDPS